MSVGVNAWNIANPILSNVDKVLLSTHTVVSGDTEVLFDSSLVTDKYDRFIVDWFDVMGTFTLGLAVTFSVSGIFQELAATYWTRSLEGAGTNYNEAFWRLAASLGSDPQYPVIGELELFTGKVAGIGATISFKQFSAPSVLNFHGGGTTSNIGKADGIKFKSAGGAGILTAGTFRLFGVPNS